MVHTSILMLSSSAHSSGIACCWAQVLCDCVLCDAVEGCALSFTSRADVHVFRAYGQSGSAVCRPWVPACVLCLLVAVVVSFSSLTLHRSAAALHFRRRSCLRRVLCGPWRVAFGAFIGVQACGDLHVARSSRGLWGGECFCVSVLLDVYVCCVAEVGEVPLPSAVLVLLLWSLCSFVAVSACGCVVVALCCS